MCGVIGFASERHRSVLGLVAAKLLKTLEYRGYDSTGAAIQGDGESVVLRKGVGAPRCGRRSSGRRRAWKARTRRSSWTPSRGRSGASSRGRASTSGSATAKGGEFVEYTPEAYRVHAIAPRGALAAGSLIERHPTRSRLRARDAALLPPFTTFMVQEIVAQEETCRRIHALLHGGSQAARALAPLFDAWSPDERRDVETALSRMRDEYDDDRIRDRFHDLVGLPAWERLVRSVPGSLRESLSGAPAARLEEGLASQEAGLFSELMERARSRDELFSARLLAIAKEGALKIREVVLNHTEGFEGSEFKHGPNTILGVNTIFGIDDVVRLLERTAGRPSAGLTADALHALYQDYPLVFVTGPDETDVNLTVSQVNTHKIRGTACVMVAEEHPALRQAVTKPPADNPDYRSVYIALPRTDDNLMVLFSATVVLQRLALRMSQMKLEYLDRLGFPDHGVHPDVPKNVSKSITVD